jgi:hypothetical protein
MELIDRAVSHQMIHRVGSDTKVETRPRASVYHADVGVEEIILANFSIGACVLFPDCDCCDDAAHV